MSAQESTSPFNVHSSLIDPRAGFSSVVPDLRRRGTMSTVGSERDSNIPSGIWRLLIHGNCPRCSHRHKAASIQFKVSKDTSEATPIQCERCDHRWLTIGGRNNTETSLLSTQTNDPDVDEISFRRALFSIVRSATALDSVPEGPSREPSRGNLAQRQTNDGPERVSSDVQRERSHAASTPGQGHDVATASVIPQQLSTRQELLSNNVKLTKVLIRDLKRKLRYHFPILNKVHLTKALRPSTPSLPVAPTRDAPRDALPEIQATASDSIPPAQDTAEQVADHNDNSTQQQTKDVCTPATSATHAIEEMKNIDKEMLKAMTNEQRITWMRERITAFKCRCSRQCTCRRRRSSSFMVDSSTQVHILPPGAYEQYYQHPRRHSLEGIGSHLDYFAPGQLFNDQPLTISATRTSEADTIVESTTVNSSPRTSRVDFVQRQRHRSWSPRPASLINLRHSLPHRAPPRLENQPSMDSIITNAATRSSSRGGRRRLDRRSFVSLPPPAIPSRAESPMRAHNETPSDQAEQPRTAETPLNASTPQHSRQLVEEERNETSRPTSPSNPPA